MKELYREWYWPDDDDLRAFVTEGRIVLDANVLLDLYRHSATNRDRLLDALNQESVRPRLFLPFQAGLEYHRNRLAVAIDHESHYKAVLDAVAAVDIADVRQAVAKLRDEDVRASLTRQTEKVVRKAQKTIRRAVEAEQEANVLSATALRVKDPIRDRIERLVADEGQIGRAPTSEEDAEWKRELDEAENPPGRKDSKKDDGGYGDYFIWKEMKRLALETSASVLFVSGDDKEDWMERPKGKTLGPRTDLRREFFEETKQPFHKVDWSRFLELLNEHLGSGIEQQVIDATKARPADIDSPPRRSSRDIVFESASDRDRRDQMRRLLDATGGVSQTYLAGHLQNPDTDGDSRSALEAALASRRGSPTAFSALRRWADAAQDRPELSAARLAELRRRIEEVAAGEERRQAAVDQFLEDDPSYHADDAPDVLDG